MQIEERTGNLFDMTDLDAIGHGVNTVGAMGAGIAKMFSATWKNMYLEYREECRSGILIPGTTSIYPLDDSEAIGSISYVVNIASQDNPGANARYEWLESGLSSAVMQLTSLGVRSFGIPMIGAGIGGLEPEKVLDIFQKVQDGTAVQIVVVHFG